MKNSIERVEEKIKGLPASGTKKGTEMENGT